MSSVDPITIRPQSGPSSAPPPLQATSSSSSNLSPTSPSPTSSKLDLRNQAASPTTSTSNIGSWLSTASLGPPSPGSMSGGIKSPSLFPGMTLSLPVRTGGNNNAAVTSIQTTTKTTTTLPWTKEELILKSPTLEATSALSQSFGTMGISIGSSSPRRTRQGQEEDALVIEGEDEVDPNDEGVQVGPNSRAFSPVPPSSQGLARGQARPSGVQMAFDAERQGEQEREVQDDLPAQSRPTRRFSFNNTNADNTGRPNDLDLGMGLSAPITIPAPDGQARTTTMGTVSPESNLHAHKGSVSAYLFGGSPTPSGPVGSPGTGSSAIGLAINNDGNGGHGLTNTNTTTTTSTTTFSSLGPSGPISPPIISASANAAWGKSASSLSAAGLGEVPGGQGGVVDGKLERGHGVLRRLSLGGSARPTVKRTTPPATQEFVNPFDRQAGATTKPPEIRIERPTDPGQPVPGPVPITSSDQSRSLPSSTMNVFPRPTDTTKSSSSAAAYNNPFSGFSHSFDDHEHHDEEHAYERAFGRVGGSLLGRTKSIGSASSTGAVVGEQGRRASVQSGEVESPASGGMRPRRVSFGWTGFSKPAPAAPATGPAQDRAGQTGPRPDGLPAASESGGLKVGRGRSGSGSAGTGGGGKKRSVSPMSEHLLRGSGHF